VKFFFREISSYWTQLFAIMTLFFLVPFAYSFTVPTLSSPVVDEAGILSERTRNQLNLELTRLRESGGSQLSVLTIKSLDGLEIEQASIKVAEAWKLGGQAKDDGVLLMIAPAERRIRIEVGYGKEGDLPDAIARRIIDQIIKPSFRERDFNSGVIYGVAAIIQHTDPSFSLEGSIRPKRVTAGRMTSNWFGLIVIFLFFVATILQKLGRNPESYLSTNVGSRRVRGAFGRSHTGWSGGGGWSGVWWNNRCGRK
jgi:uncharacterized protein